MGEGEDFALNQMRNAIEKLGCPAERYEDPTLMRFLIARSMDPKKAAKMFVEWYKWRTSTVCNNGFIPECEISDELEAKKVFLQGLSQDKYPLLIVHLGKHIPAKDHTQFKKFVVHLLDKTIASAVKGREVGNEKLIAIVDLQNLMYKNIDTRGFITGFKFLQAYYPERLAKLYFLNMPQFFVSVWRLICRFLEKPTLEKIVIVGNENERRQFIEGVGEEVLPEEYGGRTKLVPLQDVALTPPQSGATN